MNIFVLVLCIAGPPGSYSGFASTCFSTDFNTATACNAAREHIEKNIQRTHHVILSACFDKGKQL